MLHILWILIKFILIILEILLGLALLAVLLLLFCPVRYQARAVKEAGSHTSYTVLSGTLSDVGQQRSGKLGTCQVHSQGQLAFRTGILADLLSGWKRKTQSEACWYLAVWKKEKKKKKEA